MSNFTSRNSSSDGSERSRTEQLTDTAARIERQSITRGEGETVTVRHLGTIDLSSVLPGVAKGKEWDRGDPIRDAPSEGYRAVYRAFGVGLDAHGGWV